MKVIDLCAGAGGLSLGFQRAAFDVHGVELDADACATHRENVGPCDESSLWDWSPAGPVDVVAGGLPCQSHSGAGKRTRAGRAGTGDARGQLYVPFLRIAREAGARAVLIENVRDIRTSPSETHGTALCEIMAAIEASGFSHVASVLLNAADYGAPQARKRLFIVGFRNADEAARFRWPAPTHSRDAQLFGLAPWSTVREALGEITPATEAALSAIGLIDRVSTTIDTTGQLSTAGYHSTNKAGAIRLPVESFAALQSFPPLFVWHGTKTSQHRQVGNAVPPPLAEALARSLHAALAPPPRPVPPLVIDKWVAAEFYSYIRHAWSVMHGAK